MNNKKESNQEILEILQCPNCKDNLGIKDQILYCKKCNNEIQIFEGKYIFTQYPEEINPSELRERGSKKNTNWRKENTKFLEKHLKRENLTSLVLDVGAGRGDFSPYYEMYPHYLLDVYPYPEIDIVCDLTKKNPFKPESIDIILLLNVLEHVHNPSELLISLQKILKPEGKVFITVPFLLKIHQSPLDFHRMTHYEIEELAKDAGFSIAHIDGVYDPVGLIRETVRYFRFWSLPSQKKLSRIFSRVIILLLTCLLYFLEMISQKVHLQQPFYTDHPAPLGYQVIFQKNS